MSTELSGVDLARQALVAAREATRKNGAARKEKPKRRTGTVVRRDCREPLGLGSAISIMTTERGMVVPPEPASSPSSTTSSPRPRRNSPVTSRLWRSTRDTGRLDVAPDAPAYGTKLRWSAPKLVAAANEKVQGANVRTLHVLAPAPVTAGPAADPTPPTVPAVPVQRRTPPDGYRRAIDAHRQAIRSSRVDSAIAEAVERQTAAMRELSRRAW